MIRRLVKETCYNVATAVLGDPNGLVALPVFSGPAKGLRFQMDLKNRKEAYFWGKYDQPILAELSSIIHAGWTIWDCGIYLGYYTVFFARAVGPGGHVIAIEPDSRNLGRTAANVALNDLKNVDFLNLAVGAPVGKVEFLLSDDTNSHLPGCYVGTANSKNLWGAKDAILAQTYIDCVSLDQVYIERRAPAPNLIKLDIEGAERDALRHLHRLTTEVRPLIVLELHNPECDAAAWEFSRSSGYRLRSFDTGNDIVRQEDVHGTLLCYPS